MNTYQAWCSVTQAGALENGNVVVGLAERDGNWGTLQFEAAPEGKNQLLASALAAMASGTQVWVQVQAATQPTGNDLSHISGVLQRLLLVKG